MALCLAKYLSQTARGVRPSCALGGRGGGEAQGRPVSDARRAHLDSLGLCRRPVLVRPAYVDAVQSALAAVARVDVGAEDAANQVAWAGAAGIVTLHSPALATPHNST